MAGKKFKNQQKVSKKQEEVSRKLNEVDESLKDKKLTVSAVDELVRLRSIYVFLTNATQIFVLERLEGSVKEIDHAIAGYYETSDWVNKRFDNLIKRVHHEL